MFPCFLGCHPAGPEETNADRHIRTLQIVDVASPRRHYLPLLNCCDLDLKRMEASRVTGISSIRIYLSNRKTKYLSNSKEIHNRGRYPTSEIILFRSGSLK